jgi:hypothetical protein
VQVLMATDAMKTKVNAMHELKEDYADLIHGMRGTIEEVKATKHLWKDGNKSKLVKLGLALIVFPEPTPISETIGSFLVAAGMVQNGIRSRAIYVEDVQKTFQKTLKEIRDTKHSI